MPRQPFHNHLDRKNKKNDGEKDGIRALGSNSKALRKVALTRSGGMDEHHRNKLEEAANRLKNIWVTSSLLDEDATESESQEGKKEDTPMAETEGFFSNSNPGNKDLIRDTNRIVSLGESKYLQIENSKPQEVPSNCLKVGRKEESDKIGIDKLGGYPGPIKSRFGDSGKSPKVWADMVKPKVIKERMSFEYHCPEVVEGRVVIRSTEY